MEGLEFPALPEQIDETEWEYQMRRDMQEIVPNVFLGPYCVANKKRLDYLLGHGISHIICIRHPMEANIIKPNFLDRIKYLVLDIIDSPSDNIITFFPQIKQYIDEALQAGGKVLMHGNAGISRSATFMIAYLMETYGQTYRDAFFYVQQKRFCISPNDGFVRQLLEYEPIYLAKFQSRNKNPEASSNGVKRSYDSDMEEDEFENTKRR